MPSRTNLLELLKRCTVRLSAKAWQGTGFFVQPQWIVTCAHVMRSQAPESTDFTIQWEGKNLTGRLVKRFPDPVTEDPYPDVAFIRIEDIGQELNHPWVIMDVSDDSWGLHDSLYAFGYPQGRAWESLTAEVDGITAYVGEEDDQLLRFKYSQVKAGLSGSPILNERTLKVCGMIKRTRDERSDLGGLAVMAPILDKYLRQLSTDVVSSPEWETAAEEYRVLRRNRTSYRTSMEFPAPSPEPLPSNYAERSRELSAICQLLLDNDQHVAIVAIQGMGGLGKTVLAKAVMHETAIREQFCDGIFFVTLGQKISPTERLARLRDIIRRCGGQPHFETLDGCNGELRRVLRGKAILVVVDDVWDARHLNDYRLDDSDNSRILLTTREERVVQDSRAALRRIGTLDPLLARGLLKTTTQREKLPGAAADILKYCGGLPLAISIIGGRLRRLPDSKWKEVVEQLRHRNRRLLQGAPLGYTYESVWGALEASLEAMDETARDCFLDLAVFPLDHSFPISVAGKLWGVDPSQAKQLMIEFVDHSLAVAESSDRYSLHDLLHEFLGEEVKPRLAGLHATLVNAFGEACSQDWCAYPDDDYYYRFLPWHMFQADRHSDLKSLLFSGAWLMAKLRFTDADALADDYRFLPDSAEAAELQQAISLASPVLAQSPRELTAQLNGRLERRSEGPTTKLLGDLTQLSEGPIMIPATPSLNHFDKPDRVYRVGHASDVNAVAFFDSDTRLISISDDKTVRIWDCVTGDQTGLLSGPKGMIECVGVSPDEKLAVTGDSSGAVWVWDLVNQAELFHFKAHKSLVLAVTILHDGSGFITGGDDGEIRQWDWNGREIRSFQGHEGNVRALATLCNSQRLLSGGSDGILRIWDRNVDPEIAQLPGHAGRIRTIASLIDERFAISGGSDQIVRLWDLEEKKEVRPFVGHNGDVWAVARTPDGQGALSGGGDGTMLKWDLASGTEVGRFEEHTGNIWGIAISSSGRFAATAGGDRTVRMWDLERNRSTILGSGVISGPATTQKAGAGDSAQTFTGGITGLDLLPGGQRLLIGGADGTMRLWDLTHRHQIASLSGHRGGVTAIHSLPDGEGAVSGDRTGVLRLWRWQTNEKSSRTFKYGPIVSIALLGSQLVCAASSGRIWTVDIETLELGRIVGEHVDGISALVALQDGRRVVSAGKDHTIRLWDASTGKELAHSSSQGSSIRALAIAASSESVISGDASGIVRIWEPESGEASQTIIQCSSAVNGLAVFGDGKYLVTAEEDRQLRLWSIASRTELAAFHAEGSVTCCVTREEPLEVIAADGTGRMHILDVLHLDQAKPTNEVRSPR